MAGADDELKMLKYELKEKDLDIVQLQKEINELQLENKMLKVRMPLVDVRDDQIKSIDLNNPYVNLELILITKSM